VRRVHTGWLGGQLLAVQPGGGERADRTLRQTVPAQKPHAQHPIAAARDLGATGVAKIRPIEFNTRDGRNWVRAASGYQHAARGEVHDPGVEA